jgi:hypothetical protein
MTSRSPFLVGAVPVSVGRALPVGRLPQSIVGSGICLPETDSSCGTKHVRHAQAFRTVPLTILAPTRIHLPIGTIAHTVNRPVMALVHFRLLAAVEVVYADPGVGRGADDESVAVDRVERGGGDGVRKGY